MRVSGFLSVAGTFVAVALVAYAIIRAVGWEARDFALAVCGDRSQSRWCLRVASTVSRFPGASGQARFRSGVVSHGRGVHADLPGGERLAGVPGGHSTHRCGRVLGIPVRGGGADLERAFQGKSAGGQTRVVIRTRDFLVLLNFAILGKMPGMAKGKTPKPQFRFGIGEWYGQLFSSMTAEKRLELEAARAERTPQACPFQSTPDKFVRCNKEGGVCSLRLYAKDAKGVRIADPPRHQLRTTCPNRFKEGGIIYRWVAETILGYGSPVILKEIPFLESTVPPEVGEEAGDVGLIDNILVAPDSDPLRWCALEVQAVYFSGASMSKDFEAFRRHADPGIPFPAGNRRPDYRSSAPKRLMPQLQIKVPSLRRWGKKMAVVIDQDFFKRMGPMIEVSDVSNCDVAWFIVRFKEKKGTAQLVRDQVKLTTLEHSVEGLTAGVPVSLGTFEDRIRERMA